MRCKLMLFMAHKVSIRAFYSLVKIILTLISMLGFNLSIFRTKQIKLLAIKSFIDATLLA